MRNLAIITAVFCASLIVSNNQLTPYNRIQESEKVLHQLGAGFIRGSYESLVYSGLITVPVRHVFGQKAQYATSGLCTTLTLPHTFTAIKLQCLHHALRDSPCEQSIDSFSSRQDAERSAALSSRMHEVGHIIGSLATTGVVAFLLHKYWDQIPEADQKKILGVGWMFGSLAWLTQDYGRNMRS